MNIKRYWFVLCFLVMPLGSGFCPAAQAAEKPDCALLFYLGEVQARAAGDTAWKEVEIGMALGSGSTVRTGAESRAELELKDGSRIDVQEKSLFEIKTADAAKQQHEFTVTVGKVYANIRKLSGDRANFRFNTPTAVAAIRGTKIIVGFVDGRTVVKLTEGKVEMKLIATGDTTTLKEGQQITVNSDKFEVAPIPAADPDTAKMPGLDMPSFNLSLDDFVTWPADKMKELKWEFSYDLPIKVSFDQATRRVRIEALKATVEGDFTISVTTPDGQKSTQTVKISTEK
jgi:hypothetical protein